MLSVIIPHHKETIAQMNPLLSSLNAQVGINFDDVEFLIINDNKEGALKKSDFNPYINLTPRVRIFFNNKEGYMGISRQIGIDNAGGDYLIFCDADDALYSITILYDLSTRKGADVYSYGFIEQMGDGRWVEHPSQFTWMFAKSYRKQFLTEHNVRFSEDILWHEDTYFNQVLLAYNPVIEHLTYTGYAWLYSPNTITRRNNAEYTSKSMCMFVDALDARLERIKYVISSERFASIVIEDIAYMYSILQNNVQLDILNQVRKDIEERLSRYVKKYDSQLVCISPDAQRIICDKIKGSFNNSLFIPNEGFNSFIERIVKEYN